MYKIGINNSISNLLRGGRGGRGLVQVKQILLPLGPGENGYRVRLGVENVFVERDELLVCEEQECVFESVYDGPPSVTEQCVESGCVRTFQQRRNYEHKSVMSTRRKDGDRKVKHVPRHVVLMRRRNLLHVFDRRIRRPNLRMVLNAFEERPSALSPFDVARRAPH